MTRYIGTTARGLRAPIFKSGDDIVKIIPDLLMKAAKSEPFELRDRDVLAITESVVARTQNNYATTDDIRDDVRRKMDGHTEFGLTLPILSRNRFSILLKGIAAAADHIYLQLSYPADEVGNHLFPADKLIGSGINPWEDTLTEAEFREHFGETFHAFTGIDYIAFYREIIENEGAECTIIFSNDCCSILDYTDHVIVCDIHSRATSKKLLRDKGAKLVIGLDDILNDPSDAHGYNEQYGLLGSNKADDDRIKLFPRECQNTVDRLAAELRNVTGKHIEVMIYGDGAFKDPVGRIWELADPVVSPAYTEGLEGTPNEMKLKYLADKDYKDLSDEALQEAITERLRHKEGMDSKAAEEIAEGTTPRRLTDLLGSLADLTSGSGDKGTPIVYIQGYFDNYSD